MLTLTASGSVSDYSDTSSLQQSVATAAGVDKSLVTINVAAASVIITATISVPASTNATTLQNALSSNLATAAAASTALGVTVESVPTVALASPPPPPSPPMRAPVDGAVVGGIVAGVVAMGLIGLGILIRSNYLLLNKRLTPNQVDGKVVAPANA